MPSQCRGTCWMPIYAFPPLRLIHRVLLKVHSSRMRLADSTPLTQETVVPNYATPTSRRADLPSTNPEPVISEQGPDPPPRTPAPTSNCMETIRDTFRAGGLSTDAASLASHSRRPSTLKTYDSRVSRFIKWSLDRETDPTTASLAELSDFLTTPFQELPFSNSCST